MASERRGEKILTRIPAELRKAFVLFFAYRLPWLLVIGAIGALFQPESGAYGMPPLEGPTWADRWLRWDSGWYVRIIRAGYSASECGVVGAPCVQANIAFLPAYPMLVRLLMRLGLPMSVASFALNAVLLIALLWGLKRLALITIGHRAAARVGWSLLLFPTSLFLSAGYSEALFLSCAVWAFIFMLKDRALPASSLLAIAALSRPYGVVFAVCFLFGCVWRTKWRTAIASSLAFVSTYGLYFYWQKIHFGDPLAFFHARRAWGFNASALSTFAEYAYRTVALGIPLSGTQDFFGVGLILASAVWSYRKVGIDLALFCLLLGVVPLSQGQVWGMSRGVLGGFPMFLMLASVGPRWRKHLVVAGAVLLTVNAIRFVAGYWVA
jgi:hypothetical protein